MAKLLKSLSLYERDEKGELIPQEVLLALDEKDKLECPELVGMTVDITPMTRGEMRKLFNLTGKAGETKPDTDKDSDGELIKKHCFDPVYEEADIPFIKPVVSRSLVATIFRESGIKIESTTGKKSMEDNDEFGKNS